MCVRHELSSWRNTLPGQNNSRYLDFTQQIGTSLLLLVRSRVRNSMCSKIEISWQPEYPQWPGYSIIGFFSSSEDTPGSPTKYWWWLLREARTYCIVQSRWRHHQISTSTQAFVFLFRSTFNLLGLLRWFKCVYIPVGVILLTYQLCWWQLTRTGCCGFSVCMCITKINPKILSVCKHKCVCRQDAGLAVWIWLVR